MLTPLRSEDLARRLWQINEACDDTYPSVVRKALSFDEVKSLPRGWEVDDANFHVTLANGPNLTRLSDLDSAQQSYNDCRRTRLFESVHTRHGEWQAIVAGHLAAWLDREILSSVYQAEQGDYTLPTHSDAWHNIVLQLDGTKRWHFGDGRIVLAPGDVLIVPTAVEHFVKTDDYSIHINFEVIDPQTVEQYIAKSTSSPFSE